MPVEPLRLWQLRVFTGPGALGNTTGVVTVDPGTSAGEMARWAAMLGYPDTAFIRGTAQGLEVLTFSPYGEMRLCTQTLLATEFVLRTTGEPAPGEPWRALTRAGTVSVLRDDDAVGYVDLPAGRTSVRRAGGAVVVDTGRARAYFTRTPGEVEATRLSPAEVRDYCRAEEVSGICLVAPTADPWLVRMRVFTMSLDGAEDAATGGAAGGLPALWHAEGRPWPGQIRVDQGTGGPPNRALLHVRATAGTGAQVGGRVELIASGRLMSPPA